MSAADRRRQIEDVCHAALEQAPTARASFIADACGSDEDLRCEVEALLAHAQTAEGFLATPLEAVAAQALREAPASWVGRALGPYQIQARLGSGGMGEVYRARDNRLRRDVAIKILPRAFTSDPERLARFEREARMLASLNHPNIAHIHGLEDSTGEPALVMELVYGPTLADRVARGPIPIEEALPIARQIAEALEAAHEQGIIHRDLKPANIKVRADGTVKVLDFGLAKAMEPTGIGLSSVSQSPTITTPAMTQAGVILGTAAYMSPEQARGTPVDQRSDVWSLGCVLFEMITGRRAFHGESVSDTLAAVLRGEPDWAALPPNTTSAVARLLRRSLTKDVRARLSDMAMVRLELEDAAIEARGGAEVVPANTRRGSTVRRIAIYAVVAAAAITIAAVASRSPAAPMARPIVRFPIELSDQTLNMDSPNLAISPDGKLLAYAANQRLYLRALDRLEPTAVAGTEAGGIGAHARAPFFSPDGQWVAFWQQGQLWKVAVSGGVPVPICTVGDVPFGASWAPDGDILFGSQVGAIMRVAAAGGTPAPVIAQTEGQRASNPHALPSGRGILYRVRPVAASSPDQGQIVVQLQSNGEHRVQLDYYRDLRYVPPGFVLYARGTTVFAQRFDLDRLTLSGEPVPMFDDIATEPRLSSMQWAVSETGTAVSFPRVAGATALTRLVLVGRDGAKNLLANVDGMTWYPRFSPDGTRVAYGISAGTALNDAADLWVRDMRGALTRVTWGGNNRFVPTWTRDGARLTFADGAGQTNRLLSAPADGSGQLETLLDDGGRQSPSSWSPDGHTLAFYKGGTTSTGPRQLWMLHLDGDKRTTTRFLVTPFQDRGAIFSPSGRWVAYVSNKSGQSDIYARPYPGPGSEVTISVGGGAEPVWARSGNELFYRRNRELLVVRVEERAASLTVGSPSRVFDDPYRVDISSSEGGNRNYDISPDGSHFVMVEDRRPESARLQVIVNWTEELKARVPKK